MFKSYKPFVKLMEDKILFKLALVFALVGLVCLFFISNVNESKVYDLEEGDSVKLKGVVTNVIITDFLRFDLEVDEGTFKVVASSGNLVNGDKVLIEGNYEDGVIKASKIVKL